MGMSGADGMQESWKSGRLFGWVGKKDPKYRSCILESKTTRIFSIFVIKICRSVLHHDGTRNPGIVFLNDIST